MLEPGRIGHQRRATRRKQSGGRGNDGAVGRGANFPTLMAAAPILMGTDRSKPPKRCGGYPTARRWVSHTHDPERPRNPTARPRRTRSLPPLSAPIAGRRLRRAPGASAVRMPCVSGRMRSRASTLRRAWLAAPAPRWRSGQEPGGLLGTSGTGRPWRGQGATRACPVTPVSGIVNREQPPAMTWGTRSGLRRGPARATHRPAYASG